MNSADIVAYTFAGGNYHPQCLRLPTGEGEAFDGWALAASVFMSVEDDLDQVANALQINRRDETTFDSDEFPKVVFLDQVVEGECCFRCGEDLIEFTQDPWKYAMERN